ncbi:hypothetical protein DICPUDRAFT_73423 [Dictyostelium purpureum]|uniref:ADP-ribosylation factor n=1 Tax=Dictyostelium purpureum TaxID=5786 RepID=F1A051_DICPU|nr:uncharacterized protein DICPUDRAFT_73423 [Dictyostelium purpureum]EGC30424.1 hypothetical protein DICPUDRAFT_73423 [Dictyostelium purpureum]|eukprot:XP_003293048.1 hypothetical protein DICPUDRAFT_73423 [Dictyostelium purpureum]
MLDFIINSISSLFSNIFRLFEGKKDSRLLMIGLDGAGKTTILYKLKLGDIVSTIPTIGFNVETLEYKNISCTIFDVGGQERLRALWRHYYQGTQGLIFVLDSSDRERMNEVKHEIDTLRVQDELRDTVFLIFANKQDQINAMSVSELACYLELDKMNERKWFIQPTSALNGQGIYEGMEGLSKNLNI